MLRLLVRASILAVIAAACLMLPALGLLPTSSTTAVFPFRGGIDWEIVLCDYSDSAAVAAKYGISPQPYHNAQYYQDLFFTSGTQGMQDYIAAVSYGAAHITGHVHGWYHESITWEADSKTSRSTKVQHCLTAASATATAPYTQSGNQRVYVITSPGVDIGGYEESHAIGQDWTPVFNSAGVYSWTRHLTPLAEIAHEFGHGIGLGHSFSNDLTWVPNGYGANGEYDNQFDLMSAANIFGIQTTQFASAPPFLDAHHLDELGWLPMDRIVDVGALGVTSRTVTLASLTHPKTSGDLMARVLFDQHDQFHYYTVEFRTADGWDAGWANKTVPVCKDTPAAPICKTQPNLSIRYPNAMIMINEVQKNNISRTGSSGSNSYQNGSYYTSLHRQLGTFAGSGYGVPVQSLNENGVTISVVKISGDQATVKITTHFQPTRVNWTEYGPLTCKEGYVWRAADHLDYVCVTPANRQAAADENAAAASHRSGSGCAHNYVERGAYPGDNVCVTQSEHDQAQSDNKAAAGRFWNEAAYDPEGSDTRS
jgi:M6 family metalloprotease-like protein